MTLTTSPMTRVPTGYLSATFSHGLALFCLSPSAIFSRSLSTCRTMTSIWSSILSMSLGWLIRPQLMSVMCSRPSMPPKVDEGAEVGDVLDDALAHLADLDLLQQLLLLLLAGDLDQLAAADHDVAPAFVDLEDHALDVLIDEIGDVGWAANIDLAGGQEDVDTDIDQQTALDLARDASLDHVAFVVLGDDHLPVRIRCALRRERTISPVSSSMPSSRTSTASPGSGGGSSSHSFRGTSPSDL